MVHVFAVVKESTFSSCRSIILFLLKQNKNHALLIPIGINNSIKQKKNHALLIPIGINYSSISRTVSQTHATNNLNLANRNVTKTSLSVGIPLDSLFGEQQSLFIPCQWPRTTNLQSQLTWDNPFGKPQVLSNYISATWYYHYISIVWHCLII